MDSNVTVKIDTRGSLVDGEELLDEKGIPIGISAAIENFVGVEAFDHYVRELTQDILEGNLREIIGKMTLESMVTDRKELAERVLANAVPDLEGLGLVIKTFNIQSFTDETGVINKLGAENEEEITKRAELVKTKAEEEKSIARSRSEQAMHEARVSTERLNAEQNQHLALQQAELETARAKAQAEANAAESLEKARQDKQIEKENAEVKRIKSEADILIRENEAKATERIAIDNQLYARQKEADGVLAQAKADAQATKLRGDAEADAIRKRQEAMAEFSDADLRLKELETLEKISENLMKPLEKIGEITVYGGGDGTNMMSSMTQMMNQFSNSAEDSGLNIQSLLTGAMATKVLSEPENTPVKEVIDTVEE